MRRQIPGNFHEKSLESGFKTKKFVFSKNFQDYKTFFLNSLFHFFLIPIFFVLVFASCASSSNLPKNSDFYQNENGKTKENKENSENLPKDEEKTLTMTFAGDIMAHSVNYKMGNFSKIWRDVAPLLSESDLNFANIEAPVADNLEWSTYPAFNMHSSYVEAAIKAGFNVFSLANNHTNDQYLEGIKATRNYFSSRKEIWAAGLREKSFGDMTYSLIEKNGWKVLFVAVTELLNRPDYASYIDYYPSSEKKRNELKENLKNLRAQNDADLLVVSVHTDEIEYVRKVTESHKIFFRELISDCGADIIWANHPHLVKIWETVDLAEEKPNGLKKAFIMYANGNTISGQRTSPSFSKSPTERDDTGEGVFIKVKIKKSGGKLSFEEIEPHFITTYINPSWQFVVKSLDDGLIRSLDRSDLEKWANYLQNRKEILEQISKESKISLNEEDDKNEEKAQTK